MLTALSYHMDELKRHTATKMLFPKTPTLYFESEEKCCCGHKPNVQKTTRKKVATLSIGTFYAHETKLICGSCKQYYVTPLAKIVPARCRFGFDVIDYVGKALFVRCRQDAEIQIELRQMNIIISLSEIAYLGKKFIVYLALAHQESRDKIKSLMKLSGGYILHLDGTCESDSPHLMSSIDGLSDIVLGNLKMSSENTTKIISFLEKIKENYGKPIALVHDMSNAIISAVEKVFPKIPDYICHFHFLKDIGKDLFGLQYNSIRRQIKIYRVRSKLREMLRILNKLISEDTALQGCLIKYLAHKNLKTPAIKPTPLVSIYLAIAWILESNRASNGFGFPFDRPHLDFCMRLKEAYPTLRSLQEKIDKNKFQLQLSLISRFLQDKSLKNTIGIIQRKIECFDKLRDAMRIALSGNKSGLNDYGDANIKTIKEKVIAFRKSKKLEQLALTDISYHKMLKQIDKYSYKLFADPIKVSTPTGLRTIQPQRTNNIMEQFFREIKRGYRKKSGAHSLSKTLKAMLTETPLVKNLDNPEYLKIILNGKNNLSERFADIDIKQVRATMIQEKQAIQKYPEGMAKIFRIPHLPSKLVDKKVASIALV